MIGILIIAHGTLSDSLAAAVTHVLGARPSQFQTLEVSATDDPLHLLPKARELVAELDTGDGVLIFSDIYGATPCNLADQAARRTDVSRVSPASICPCWCGPSPTATRAWKR